MGGFGILKGIGAGLASAAGNDTMLKDMELEKRRKMAASDDFAMGQVKLLTEAITNLQNNPTLSPEEKAAKIGAARSEMLKYYTPMIGKKRAAEFQKQFGLSTTPAMSGMTPAEAPVSVSPEAMGGQPQQAPFSEEEIASSGGAVGKPSPEAIQVPSEMAQVNLGQPQPLELPGKQPQQVSYAPPSGDEILAGTQPTNPMMLYRQQLIAANFTPEQADRAVRIKAGLEAPPRQFAPHSGQWETVYGTLNGQPYAYKFSKALGQMVDLDNNPLTSEDLVGFVPSVKQGALKEAVVPDKESSTGYSKIAYNPQDGSVKSKQKDILPPRGFIESLVTTKDQFGNETVSHRVPLVSGNNAPPVPSQANSPSPQAGGVLAPPAPPQSAIPKVAPKAAPSVAPNKAVSAVSQPSQESFNIGLDDNGHIRMLPGMNPQVVQFANRLLDGADIKDIPQKAQAPAQQMAAKYGWKGQGFLTPKDQMMVRQSENLLKVFSESPSLAVLDDAVSRNKIAQVLKNPEKRGAIGGFIQERAAANLTPAEQEFVTLYNQAVGRIAGLSQLVRPGSRTTEAQIERLKSELPNPLTTTSSAHAKQKFAMIQNEIDTAKQKGQFSDFQPTAQQGGLQVGQQVKLKNGRTVTVKSVHPDGTFDAE